MQQRDKIIIAVVAAVIIVAAGLYGFDLYKSRSNTGSGSISLDQSDQVYILNSNNTTAVLNLSQSNSFVYVPNIDNGKLVINGTLHRIVSLVPSVTVTLYGLDAYYSTVVGVDQYSTYPTPPETVQVINIQLGSLPVESVANLSPDAVMSTSGYFTTQVINQIVNVLKIPFFVFNPNNMSQIESQNLELGALTGTEHNAVIINDWMNTNLMRLHNDTMRIPGKPISVFYDLGPGSSGLYTAGNGTFIDQIFSLVHLKNAVNETGYPELSASQIEALHPDWILLDEYYNQSSFNQSVPGYLRLIHDNATRIANDSFLNENDFRVIYAAFWMGSQFYPDYISLANVTPFDQSTGIYLNPPPQDGVNGTAQ